MTLDQILFHHGEKSKRIMTYPIIYEMNSIALHFQIMNVIECPQVIGFTCVSITQYYITVELILYEVIRCYMKLYEAILISMMNLSS